MSRVEPMPGFHVLKSPVLEAFMATPPLTVHHMGRTLGNREWGRYSSKVFYHRLYFFFIGKSVRFLGATKPGASPGACVFVPFGPLLQVSFS